MEYYLNHSFLLNSYHSLKNDELILGMEHIKLSLEYDRNLINSILNNINTKYTILYLYIIRKDLFKDLDENVVDRYEKVIILDDIYKDNVELFWNHDFIDKVIELGLFKNIRSRAEYNQKSGDFILKMGEYTITIEKNTIITPKDTLYNMISKRFKSIPQKDFELGLSKLKEVRCESTGTIHRLIYEVGDREYVLSDDLYEILDHFGNIYQAIKIEPTSDGLLEICKQIQDRIANIVMIFDPILNNEKIIKKITKALEINSKEEKVDITEISLKIKLLEKTLILTLSNSDFQILSNYKDEMELINKQLLEIKSNYSGNQEYLGFLENVPLEIENIQETLIKIRDNASGAKRAVDDLEFRIQAKASDDLEIVHEEIEIDYKVIDADTDLDKIIQVCKEIKDKTANFIRVFNPIMGNKTIISKVQKTIERNEGIITHLEDKTLEITEIFLQLSVLEKIIRLRLSNADFQILTYYKEELDRLYKKLLEMHSEISESESDISQHGIDEIRENLISARNSVSDIEKRMIQIIKTKGD